MFLYVLFVTL